MILKRREDRHHPVYKAAMRTNHIFKKCDSFLKLLFQGISVWDRQSDTSKNMNSSLRFSQCLVGVEISAQPTLLMEVVRAMPASKL